MQWVKSERGLDHRQDTGIVGLAEAGSHLVSGMLGARQGAAAQGNGGANDG